MALDQKAWVGIFSEQEKPFEEHLSFLHHIQNFLSLEYQLSPQIFSRWREELVARASEIFAAPSRGDEQARIAELERMVGRLTVELEVVKKASSVLTSLSSGKER